LFNFKLVATIPFGVGQEATCELDEMDDRVKRKEIARERVKVLIHIIFK